MTTKSSRALKCTQMFSAPIVTSFVEKKLNSNDILNWEMQSRGSLDSVYQTENVNKFKVVVLGDQGVGKSALVWKFAYSGFEEKYAPTIGIDFFTKTLYLRKCRKWLLEAYISLRRRLD